MEPLKGSDILGKNSLLPFVTRKIILVTSCCFPVHQVPSEMMSTLTERTGLLMELDI